MNIEEYAEKHKHLYLDIIPNVLADILEKEKWHSFVDLGCGDGSLLNALNNRNFIHNKEVYAVDLSQKRINNVKLINDNFKCIVSDATNVKALENNSIDIVVSTQVIEHVDDEKMINEFNRVLSKNGIIYLTTVYKKKYAWYFYRNSEGERVLDPTHLREYSNDKELIQFFKKNDLVVELNNKRILRYSLLNFFIKKLKIDRNKALKFNFLSKFLMIPIPGYYIWELVLKRKK